MKITGLLLLAVLGLTALVYANSLNGGWTFDDMALRMWLGPGLPPEAVREFGVSHRPLLFLSYWLDFKHGGLIQSFWFHITNLGIHLLMVVLVFRICLRLLDSALASAFGAALFGIHPFFSSAVDYLDGRGSMLSALLVVAGGYALVYWKHWSKWPLSILAILAGAAVKEEAALFAVLAFGFGIVYQKRWLIWGSILTGVAGLVTIVTVAPYLHTVFTSKMAMPTESLLLNGFDILTRSQQLRAVASGFVFQVLGQLAFPKTITIDPAPILGWGYFVASLLTIATMIGVILWKRPPQSLRMGMVFLLASPMLGASILMLADPLFEYRSYVCGLGFALISGTVLKYGLQWVPSLSRNVAVILLIVFGLATTQRNELWRNPEALWADAYQKGPDRIRTAQNYSSELMGNHKPYEAIAVLEKALKINPQAKGMNTNLALANLQVSNFAEAEKYAMRGAPVASSYTVLSLAQLSQGRPQEALEAANKAVDANVVSADAWSAMARAMAATGKNYESYLALARAKGLNDLQAYR